MIEDENVSFYTIVEFALKIRVHPNTVRRAIKSGRINAFRVGAGKRSSYRIPKDEINRMALVDLENLISDMINKKTTEVIF